MQKANSNLREVLYTERITFWMLAEKLRVHESTVVRWFRTELDEEHRQMIDKAINEIKKHRQQERR